MLVCINTETTQHVLYIPYGMLEFQVYLNARVKQL